MRPRLMMEHSGPDPAVGRPALVVTAMIGDRAFRLFTILGTTNLAFWLLWPAGIVAVQGLGWSPAVTGLFGSTAWLACVTGLAVAPKVIRLHGPRRATLLASGFMLAAAVGTVVAPGGVLAWIWTSLLGLALGLRWTAVDSWLTDSTPLGAKGRILSLSETIAGATFMAGPALAAALGSIAAVGWAAALCAGTGLILTRAASAPGTERRDLRPNPARRPSHLPLLAPVVLAAALWGGLFESGFSAAASLLALGSEDTGGRNWALWAAAATGAGSFVAQYGLGVLSDRWGGQRVLLGLSAALAASLLALTLLPSALVPLAAAVGAAGGGLYTVAVVVSVQTRPDEEGSAGAISSMALVYTLGTMAAPTLSGALISAVGTGGLLMVMTVAGVALLAALVLARG